MAELLLLFLKLGIIGFGGPQAHLALMQQECVTRRAWLTNERFSEGLALCSLLPGPTSTQMAIWLGYERLGHAGAIGAGLVFILPSFFLVIAFAAVYVRYGALPEMQHALYGVQPAVIAIVLAACAKLTQPFQRDAKRLGLLVAACELTLAFPAYVAGILLGAGLLGILVYGPRRSIASLHLLPLFLFFLKTGAFIFGGGLVVIPFIQGEVVQKNHWLTAQQFADAIAVGQVTPGPVVITAAFIGYLLRGWAGAATAAAGIFLPSFLLVLTLAPFLQRLKNNLWIKSFTQGVAPAVVGAILAATWGLTRALIEPSPVWNSVSLFLLAAALWAVGLKAHAGLVVVGCGLAGFAIRGL